MKAETEIKVAHCLLDELAVPQNSGNSSLDLIERLEVLIEQGKHKQPGPLQLACGTCGSLLVGGAPCRNPECKETYAPKPRLMKCNMCGESYPEGSYCTGAMCYPPNVRYDAILSAKMRDERERIAALVQEFRSFEWEWCSPTDSHPGYHHLDGPQTMATLARLIRGGQ